MMFICSWSPSTTSLGVFFTFPPMYTDHPKWLLSKAICMLRPFVIAIRIHSSCQVLFDGCEGILTLRVATILQPYHMRAWALFHWGSPKILALWGPPGGPISLVIWGRGAPYRGGPHIAPTPEFQLGTGISTSGPVSRKNGDPIKMGTPVPIITTRNGDPLTKMGTP